MGCLLFSIGIQTVLNLKRNDMTELNGKCVIAIGERDGIPGQAIATVGKAAGAREVVPFTQCFV